MSNDLFAGIGVVPGTFLLPRPDADWTAWACVACDQYTSEPEYWQRVNTLVGHQPSTLRLILPECDLPAPPERIDAIHAAMRDALNVLHPGVTDGFVLLERTTSTGKRLGLVCCVDLERYRYDGAKTLIRPTEETVASRLPARLAVRNGAPLESSHVMLLLDDPQRTVIEPLYARRDQLSPLYDFDLMQQSGHARGWAVTSDADKAAIAAALNRLKMLSAQTRFSSPSATATTPSPPRKNTTSSSKRPFPPRKPPFILPVTRWLSWSTSTTMRWFLSRFTGC